MSEQESATRQRLTSRQNRPTKGLIQDALDNIEHDPAHHITGAMGEDTPDSTPSNRLEMSSLSKKVESRYPGAKKRSSGSSSERAKRNQSSGLWHDVRTMRWMREPASSLKLLVIPLALYGSVELCAQYVLGRPFKNPFAPLLFISYNLPDSNPSDPRFDKGWLDLAFLAYYVILFSFVRQSITIYVFIPLAKSFGIRKDSKLDRFAEQGYAVVYFGVFGSLGIYIMSGMPTWWYRTEHFWLEYPQWRMTGLMKSYYLLQAAYWVQQLLVMILGLEKPRKDFTELVIHHLVTVYLISASYIVNLTWIGNAIFITMDISDAFFAVSKIFNYLQMNRTKMVAFGWFTIVWSYTRHWLNFVIMYSVWFEFDLIPKKYMRLEPQIHAFMPRWAKYLVFLPIFLLQLVQLFWYYLIWRILIRAIFVPDFDQVTDDRSDDESDNDE